MNDATESTIRLSLYERGEPMKYLTMKLARFLAVLLLAVPLHGAWARYGVLGLHPGLVRGEGWVGGRGASGRRPRCRTDLAPSGRAAVG